MKCNKGDAQVFLKDRTMHVCRLSEKFYFNPKTMENKVTTLSRGEADRLLVAKLLINRGNFFVLDESDK